MMFRSSRHSINEANAGKRKILQSLLHEYRRVGQIMVDQIWKGLFSVEKDGKILGFHPSKEVFNCPMFVDYRRFEISTPLSARMLRCLSTHVCGVVSASARKRGKVIWAYSKGYYSDRQKAKGLSKHKAVKPSFRNAEMSLNSICADIQKGESFDSFLQLKSLGKKYGKIRIPIKENRVSLKWLSKGRRVAGISISENCVRFSYLIKRESKQRVGLPIGVDQGLKSVATLSDGSVTPNQDRHGHSMESIIARLSRRRKGGRNFARSQGHRLNFVNWSINRLDFSKASEVRLEKIWHIGFGKNRGRKLSHWTNTIIRDKIAAVCEEAEVPLVLQDCSYRSQRCSRCGMVRKSNRNGKTYLCRNCGMVADADYNASCNHAADIPVVSYHLRGQSLNKKGFFWKKEGFFDLDGLSLAAQTYSDDGEHTVPHTNNYTHPNCRRGIISDIPK